MISLKPSHLTRYKDLVGLLLKHGNADFDRQSFPESDDVDDSEAGRGSASEIADDLEALGPVYVKLGQLLSTRPDLVPPEYAETLARLQDDVEQVPFDDIRETVESELGARLSTLFETFDEQPLASASLGQVHVATMRDGRKVAVKVQRPGIRDSARLDISALSEIAAFFERHSDVGRRYQVESVVQELGDTLAEELDYRREMRNLMRLREDLSEFDDIAIPAPIEDYCTSRVLVMEYISGTPISKLSPVVRLELNGKHLADEVFRAYLHQTLVNGFFHADPHPGNVLLSSDHKVVLLDCGMVGHISDDLRGQLLGLLLAISAGDGSEAAQIALRIGDPSEEGVDRANFERTISRLVSREQGSQLADIQAGRTVLEVCRAAGQNGIFMPSELTMLGKTLLNLDEVGRALDPEFDPNEAIQRHASELMTSSMWQSASPSNLFRTLLESKELVEKAPRRLNRILERVAENDLRVKVDSFNERELLIGLQKVSNRIAGGIILGSMFIGAGLLMRIETSFTLFGYPGLAILFFLTAGVGSLTMLLRVLVTDRES